MPRIAHLAARKSIVAASREMNRLGINQGTSGNIGLRIPSGFLVTPTGIPADELEPHMIVRMGFDGRHTGAFEPSSEWRFHRDILAARPDVAAVVHCHAMFATTLAIARKDIPAVHYMIAAAGGPTIRCAPYATYGTQALSDHALAALEGRNACLLANHGMIAVGSSLDKTMWLAHELEMLAKQYYHSLLIGGPVILPDDEIERVMVNFKSYGLQDPKPEPKPGKATAGEKAGGKRKK